MALISGMPEGQYADLPNGQRMHYQDLGPRDGVVAVFLHGSGSGASGHSNFKANYPVLVEQGYRVIVPDLLGYGYSAKPTDVDYHLDLFVECIKQTLDVIGVENFTLIGNSLGGAIALRFALDYPAQTEKLVLMAPGGIEEQANYFTMPGMQMMKEVFTSADPVTPAKMRSFFETAFLVDPGCLDEQTVQERWESMQTQNPHVVKTMVVPNMEHELKNLQCPVLVFWGMNENMMPETGIMKLAKNCSNSRVILVSECGHWVMMEHAAMFNRMTLDFLANG
ncbi:alpha/beta fold hydrolase [Oceanicoccus sp. KOV_DT_Chl]|uniref:alpha/beta fold hydrolase n=1 Tax=Oceanicoccus sp. KOV_DT_Chl TaxID=1904639 RepID=UPI000C7BE01E|nr:alpha/beta hydrolase [Oceanicoccus sp. KOV_DT_Chl]